MRLKVAALALSSPTLVAAVTAYQLPYSYLWLVFGLWLVVGLPMLLGASHLLWVDRVLQRKQLASAAAAQSKDER